MKSVARVSAVVVSLFAALVAGCGSSSSPSSQGNGTSAPLATGGASTVYVVEDPVAVGLPAEVLEFPVNSSGSVAPSAILYPPSTMTVATAVATDISGQIYVGGSTATAGSYEICVFAAGATGSPTPTRTITETSVQPTSMAIDSAGLLYATGPTANVAVFSATASGAATPANVIAGALTQLNNPNAIAVDAAKNIYVTNNIVSTTGTILVFGSGATGNIAPGRVINPGTNLSFFYGVALDGSGNVYATAALANGVSIGNPAIVEYAGGVGGSATPTKTITSSALTNGYDIALDSVGNMYLVSGVSASHLSVLGFGPSATGTGAPAVNFSSGVWNYGGPQIAAH